MCHIYSLHEKIPNGEVAAYFDPIFQTMLAEGSIVVDQRLMDLDLTRQEIDKFMRNVNYIDFTNP
jgi:hypothetical protein